MRRNIAQESSGVIGQQISDVGYAGRITPTHAKLVGLYNGWQLLQQTQVLPECVCFESVLDSIYARSGFVSDNTLGFYRSGNIRILEHQVCIFEDSFLGDTLQQ